MSQEYKKSKIKKQDLHTILSAQPKETLVDILIEYAKNDKQIKNDLLLRFSKDSDITEQARNLIKSSIKKVATYHGYVEYGYTKRAVEGAKKVINMANSMIHTDSPIHCIKLFIVVLEEMMILIDICDDSNDEVGGIIEEAIDALASITIELNENFNEKTEVFDLIVDHAISTQYNGYIYWRLCILGVCVPFCKEPVLRKRLEAYLENYSKGEYNKMQAQNIQAQIIATFDGEDAADIYCANNLDNRYFRQILIEKAILRKQFDVALKLCLDGEAMDLNLKKLGLVKQWQKIRYSIYERIGDIPAQIDLAKYFILNEDFDYFPKFKLLYPSEEWGDVLEELLAEFGTKKNEVYVKILIAENLKPHLMMYCNQNPIMLPYLCKYLIPDYENEMFPLFEKLIRQEASRVSNRKGYHDVCEIIRHFKDVCGIAAAKIMVSELLEVYKKQPAFVDELNQCLI